MTTGILTTKTEQLNQLFDEWEQSVDSYKGKFVRDGIIDEQLYQLAAPKVLFITKEPNNPEQKAGDFREWWREGIAYTFSYRLAEWSYGLLNDFPQFDDIWTSTDSAHNAIKNIALMNIKKIGGTGNSNYTEMIEHLKMNFHRLHQQIEIISPDIIITGTSWKELRDELFPKTVWQNSGYDIAIGRHNTAKVIDFYHPSSRTAPAAAYSLLQNIVNGDKFKSL